MAQEGGAEQKQVSKGKVRGSRRRRRRRMKWRNGLLRAPEGHIEPKCQTMDQSGIVH